MRIKAEGLKWEARRREVQALTEIAGLPAEILDGSHHPCPQCGGKDRFRLIDKESGAVMCNQCFKDGNGDFLAAIQWARNCTFPEVIEMVGNWLGLPGASTPVSDSQGRQSLVATYDYRDENGELLFQVCRLDPKGFRQRRPDGDGGWKWSVKGCRIIPYRLPELMNADPIETVYVVEGEKDADRLASVGLLATTNAQGAEKWRPEHAAFLAGRHVVLFPDNDEKGQKHARLIAQSLHGKAASIRIVELPGLAEKGDVSDWMESGGSVEELYGLVSQAEYWEPEVEPWPEIELFEADEELPDFPVDVLPEELAEWVRAESVFTQTPLAMCGMLTLATCGAAIAHRVYLTKPWREPVNLYVAVILDPADRKSAVFKDVIEPLQEVEEELIETMRPEIAKARLARRILEAQLKDAEKAVVKGDVSARHDSEQLAVELAMTPEPVEPALIIDNSTSEHVALALFQQGGRIASMSPEGGVFDLMGGRYAKDNGTDFDVYLKAHAGDDIRTGRITRDPFTVKNPALTCAYCIQPEVVRGLAETPAFRGRGLLARFAYALPRDWVGRRDVDPPTVPERIRGRYHELVKRLARRQDDRPLTLSSEARHYFRGWQIEVETRLGRGEDMEMIRDWGGKLCGLTLRLAGVLHAVVSDRPKST